MLPARTGSRRGPLALPRVDIGPGSRALVTGASRGIGRAVAAALAARGATVGLAARSTADLVAAAADAVLRRLRGATAAPRRD